MQNPRRISLDLEEIAALLSFAGETKFKVRAYRRAAHVVNALGDDLGSLVEQGRLQELDGIGPALARQIEELWNLGSSELLTRLRREQPPGATELIQVEGMTRQRVRKLHDALGISSVQELRAACEGKRVRTVAGFGAKTEARLLASVERWLRREVAPPRPLTLAAALELAEAIQSRLSGSVKEAALAGALRRGEETVHEIEFVISGDAGPALDRVSSLRQVLQLDREHGTAKLTDGVVLRLHAAAQNAFGSRLVLATGPPAHVEKLLDRSPDKPLPAFATEAAVYASIGCAVVPPELRAGRDELDRARHEDFADLLDVSDIQGMVHCHTIHSDGKNTVLEMARATHALGMQYLTITDHSPSAHYANGVTLDRLKAQWDEIDAAREQVPIRILKGTESDILADGSLDFPDEILERFDVVIASIHARHRMARAAMTERLTRALSLPIFKIWGHALGRILNHRPPIECDVPAVLDALAGSRGAIEINADPHRLDLPPEWIPEARARKIPFVISVDAHSTRGFGVLRYGSIMARRGGITRSEVLNTLPADEFVRRVRPG